MTTYKSAKQLTANKDTFSYNFGATDFPPYTPYFDKDTAIPKGTIVSMGGEEIIDNKLYYIDDMSLGMAGGGLYVYLASDFTDNSSNAKSTDTNSTDTPKNNNLIVYGLIGIVLGIIAYKILKK